ncbi:MAG: aminopeptidase N, partial [Parvibaculum sp.]|nr:aminopeptidase N [Parvibaculum sp.]
MRTEDPRPIRLKDYTPPAFRIEEVSLEIELDPKRTRVHSRLSMRRQGEGPLVLDGEKLKLHEVRIDGEKLGANRYSVDGEHLTIFEVPEGDFTLETVTTCAPVENTALTGLYLSSDIYCTQCEAEGFRRITYYLDR